MKAMKKTRNEMIETMLNFGMRAKELEFRSDADIKALYKSMPPSRPDHDVRALIQMASIAMPYMRGQTYHDVKTLVYTLDALVFGWNYRPFLKTNEFHHSREQALMLICKKFNIRNTEE